MSSSGLNGSPEDILIGVIGGTGLDTFPDLEVVDTVRPTTTSGTPSAELVIARHAGRKFAFLPRHGPTHAHAPHKIPYRANLLALKELGVRTVLATCIVGSLKRDIEPGHFVVPDQFVHFTWGRDEGPTEGEFLHVPMADPYCGPLRKLSMEALCSVDAIVHASGTVTVIQGPRFSTRAESQMFIRNGWDIVNMTQYPECVIARELGMCYAVMASVTDWDCGVPSDTAIGDGEESMEKVLKVFRKNAVVTRQAVLTAVERLDGFACGCASRIMAPYYRQP